MNEEPEKPRSPFNDWRVRGLILIAAVVGFVAAMVVYGKPWHRPAAWGDIPTWLLAAGAGVTAWLALLQLSDLRKQVSGEIRRNEKRDRLLDKQLVEAEAREESDRRRLVEDVDILFNKQAAGDVYNKSRRPLTDITCKLMSKADRHVLINPDGCGEMIRLSDGKAIMGPYQPIFRWETLRPGARCSFLFEGHEPKPDEVLVAWFTDDAGFRWQLDEYLHLVRSDDESEYLP